MAAFAVAAVAQQHWRHSAGLHLLPTLCRCSAAVTDASFSDICHHLTLLTHLDISSADGITTAGTGLIVDPAHTCAPAPGVAE